MCIHTDWILVFFSGGNTLIKHYQEKLRIYQNQIITTEEIYKSADFTKKSASVVLLHVLKHQIETGL